MMSVTTTLKLRALGIKIKKFAKYKKIAMIGIFTKTSDEIAD